jgi:4-hydroxythreonine-4-phosphate dehydrogenase
MNKHPIALTCGEPAGIGFELAQKAWETIGQDVPFFLIADRRHVQGPFTELTTVGEVTPHLPVLHHDFSGAATLGVPDPRNAQGVIDVIARAVDLVRDGVASSMCTLPIHKKALKDGANFAYPGHTEYLAALGGVEHVVMMLASPELRVVPVTIHIALEDVAGTLTPQILRETIQITETALRQDFGLTAPRIMVAGLNPHAGEGGAMGREEIDMITPVLTELRGGGMDISGPGSADTMFHPRARAGYDVAICMYHDQALIPIKTIDFDGGVNVTLGLPFIRTSPDHGTAFDIAGKGIARPDSLIAALKMAAEMADARSA